MVSATLKQEPLWLAVWQVPQVPLKQKYQQSRVLAYKYPPPQKGLLNSHSDLKPQFLLTSCLPAEKEKQALVKHCACAHVMSKVPSQAQEAESVGPFRSCQ